MDAVTRDYYEVLGVPRDVDAKGIKDAFRRLALQYHPDRNPSPEAEARFKEIAEAYAVLSDPRRRAEYDAGGMAGLGLSPEDIFGGIDFGDIFGGLGFEFGAEGLFDRLFRRHPAGPPRGRNIEVVLEVPLGRILSGGEDVVRVARPQPCGACGGSGAASGTTPKTCDRCSGAGQLTSERREANILYRELSTCARCGGKGTIIETPCPECRGHGTVVREETLTVRVPAGAEEGLALRIPGHGLQAPSPGGPPGDLFVLVHTSPDPRFERRGADLWRLETIGIPDAVLGATISVPTLERPAKVKIPAGTQTDTILRLDGKGLPHFGSARRGDLLIRIRVEVPERISKEERRLYERLRDVGSAGRARR